MNRNRIGIQIKTGLGFPYDRKWLRYLVATCLQLEEVKEPYEINLFITDDNGIHKLNKLYRGIDRPTDVLSFSYREADAKSGDSAFVTPAVNENFLGEIVISYPYLSAQAANYDYKIEQELILIIVHGILHLLGHDHGSADEEKKMRRRELSLVRKITNLSELK